MEHSYSFTEDCTLFRPKFSVEMNETQYTVHKVSDGVGGVWIDNEVVW